MAVVSRAFDAFAVRDQLQAVFCSLDEDRKYPTISFLQQLVAFGRRLKAMTWRHNLALENIVTGLSQRVTKPGTQFVASDSTVATVFGQ
jgi:hypothetical protein